VGFGLGSSTCRANSSSLLHLSSRLDACTAPETGSPHSQAPPPPPLHRWFLIITFSAATCSLQALPPAIGRKTSLSQLPVRLAVMPMDGLYMLWAYIQQFEHYQSRNFISYGQFLSRMADVQGHSSLTTFRSTMSEPGSQERDEQSTFHSVLSLASASTSTGFDMESVEDCPDRKRKVGGRPATANC